MKLAGLRKYQNLKCCHRLWYCSPSPYHFPQSIQCGDIEIKPNNNVIFKAQVPNVPICKDRHLPLGIRHLHTTYETKSIEILNTKSEYKIIGTSRTQSEYRIPNTKYQNLHTKRNKMPTTKQPKQFSVTFQIQSPNTKIPKTKLTKFKTKLQNLKVSNIEYIK